MTSDKAAERQSFRARLLCSCVALLLCSSLSATTATTAITGKVTSGGAPAAGVTITATSKALQGQRTTMTTANGRYWLTALPPGEYDVSFSKAGMQTLIKTAIVAVARVARVDAALEPSEDEESVTSTAKVVGVADTTTITSHFDDTTLDRLPFRRDPIVGAFLAPGTSLSAILQDDAFTSPGSTQAEDALEQATVLRGALTPDYEFAPAVVHARTRAGGEDFFFSLRDTLTNVDWIDDYPFETEGETKHLFEGTAGGRVVPEKVWFFAAASHGSEWFAIERRGILGKLTAQLGAQHNLSATYDRGDQEQNVFETGTELVALRYTGIAGPRWTNEAALSHSTYSVEGPPIDVARTRHDTLFAKSTYVLGTRLGDHILSAGAQLTDDEFYDNTSVFANDRWVMDRWTVNLGLRHDDEGLQPRVSASFDLQGDGRHAIVASFGDYSFGESTGRDLTLGYATALGNGGMARVDAIRRDVGPVAFESVHFELRYSLFDRFQAAANYSWQQNDTPVLAARHTANGWISLALPVFDTHEFVVTALERYRSEISELLAEEYATDLALRYSLPIRRIGLTLAADVMNLFSRQPTDYSTGRSYRGWVRVRL